MSVTARPAEAGHSSSAPEIVSLIVARPLALAAAAYAAGDALGLSVAATAATILAFSLLALSLVALATASIAARRKARSLRVNSAPLLAVTLAAIGLLRGGAATIRMPNDVSRVATGRFVDLTGTVAAEPVRQGPGWGLTLRAERVTLGDGRALAVGGAVWAWMPQESRWEAGRRVAQPPGRSSPAELGDRVTLHGRLERPEGPRNPGGFSPAAYLASRSLGATLLCRRPSDLTVRSRGASSPIYRMAGWVRASFERAMVRTCGERDAVLLMGIVFGARVELPERLEDDFARTGTVHVLATAGLHVGLVSAGLVWLWRALRLTRKGAALATIACLVLYVLAAGGRPAMARAVIMACLYLAAYLVDREPDGATALGAAALLLLAWAPELIRDPGFQLSFVTVAVIFALLRAAESFEKRYSQRSRGRATSRISRWSQRFSSYFRSLFLLSLAAQLGAAPLTAYYFHLFSPISLLANMVVVPLVALTLAASLLIWPVSLIAPSAATVMGGWILKPLLGAMVTAVERLAAIPGASWSAGSPTVAAVAAFYGTVCFVLIWWTRESRNRRAAPPGTQAEPSPNRLLREWHSGPRMMTVRAGAALAILSWSAWAILIPMTPTLRVTFLDVGQGDAIVIESPGGRTFLVDAGPPTGDSSQGMRTVVPYLRARGIQSVDALLLTHGDLDHIGGAADILDRTDTRMLLTGNENGGAEEEIRAEETARRRGAEVRRISRGDRLRFPDGLIVTVLHPPDAQLRHLSEGDNNQSVVLRLDYGRTSILLTGDAEAPAEDEMVGAWPDSLRADILKLGHHGSRTSTSDKWLRAVRPQAAVVSCGQRNAFGHPHPDVVSRLNAAGIALFRTDRDGAIVVESDGEKVTMSRTVRH